MDMTNDELESWVSEIIVGRREENIGQEELGIFSPAFSPNIGTGNFAEVYHHDPAAMTVAMPGNSEATMQVGSSSGLAPMSTIEAAGYISSSHNRPNFPANSFQASSRGQTSDMSVSRLNQELQFPQQNIHRPSVHFSTELQASEMSVSRLHHQLQFPQRNIHPPGVATVSQHRQQLGLQGSGSGMQQQPLQFQNEVPNLIQRSLELQNNASRFPMQQQQNQQMMETPSSYLNMQANQRRPDINARPEAWKSQYNLQQLSQPTQFPQIVNTQNEGTFTSDGRRDNLQSSASLHPQTFMVSNQMNQPDESRIVPFESSSDSASPNLLRNASDWHDQAYDKLQFVKQTNLGVLMKVYKRAEELSPQAAITERRDICEKTRLFLEILLRFLQIPKSDFVRYSKHKIHQRMKLITWYVSLLNHRNTPPMQLLESAQQSISQLLGQLGGHYLQANIPTQGMTSQVVVPQFSTQTGPINLGAWATNSFRQGSLTRDEGAGSSSTNLPQYGQLSSATEHASRRHPVQWTSSRVQQTSMNNSPYLGSQRTSEHRVPNWLPHGSAITEMRNSNFGQVIMSHQRTPQQLDLTGQSMENSSQSWLPSSTEQHYVSPPQVSHPPPSEGSNLAATPEAIFPNSSSLHNNSPWDFTS